MTEAGLKVAAELSKLGEKYKDDPIGVYVCYMCFLCFVYLYFVPFCVCVYMGMGMYRCSICVLYVCVYISIYLHVCVCVLTSFFLLYRVGNKFIDFGSQFKTLEEGNMHTNTYTRAHIHMWCSGKILRLCMFEFADKVLAFFECFQ